MVDYAYLDVRGYWGFYSSEVLPPFLVELKLFPCRTLPLGIRNVVDKLFIMKSPRFLRCSLNIFPMFCPIHIGPLFHQEFHKGWARLILLAHGHGPMKPVRPHFLFLSSSTAPFTPFDPSLLCKGSIGVTVNIVLTVLYSWGNG